MAEKIHVRRMTEADIDGAVDTIQLAFKDDPYSKWIYNEESKFSPERNRISLSLRCRWGIKHGLFYVAYPASDPSRVVGTAMWLAPKPADAPESWSLYLSRWHLWLAQLCMNAVYGRGGLNVARYWTWKASQAAAQAECWSDARGYYFCNIVTVLPGWQGKGVGRKLMEVVLERADREGVGAYLESSLREPNVRIYERLGFRLVREMECKEGGEGIMLFCMIRPPKGAEEGKRVERNEVGNVRVDDREAEETNKEGTNDRADSPMEN
ncbi:acyl-CoA N-acyltransferase [Patellaria atrata CBS 101060]|uniref:Acyl-CoA N-acyltransferase n=1 Tax=Patellaria atrata CBS 101060 TaxID=1346257 RepID=A0A9P4S8S1_9PEZI|nr:acyl-CoA N-acyltransferase [Patellaria atrata CBS 101060]